MRATLRDYVREAFNARPLGMFVAPNWAALTAAGMLGFLNHGFWVIGAGLEAAYLFTLLQSERFRRYVDAIVVTDATEGWKAVMKERSSRLTADSAKRLQTLEERCRAVLSSQQERSAASELALQSEGLGRLISIYYGLLQSREKLSGLAQTSAESIMGKLKRLETQLAAEQDGEVRKSLAGQIEILKQRVAAQMEGRSKLEFLESELSRIEEQVELIREQSLLAADPSILSQRIDEVGATLSTATQWVREQRQIFGDALDLADQPHALPLAPSQS